MFNLAEEVLHKPSSAFLVQGADQWVTTSLQRLRLESIHQYIAIGKKQNPRFAVFSHDILSHCPERLDDVEGDCGFARACCLGEQLSLLLLQNSLDISVNDSRHINAKSLNLSPPRPNFGRAGESIHLGHEFSSIMVASLPSPSFAKRSFNYYREGCSAPSSESLPGRSVLSIIQMSKN
jgi:hypothetical protein